MAKNTTIEPTRCSRSGRRMERSGLVRRLVGRFRIWERRLRFERPVLSQDQTAAVSPHIRTTCIQLFRDTRSRPSPVAKCIMRHGLVPYRKYVFLVGEEIPVSACNSLNKSTGSSLLRKKPVV